MAVLPIVALALGFLIVYFADLAMPLNIASYLSLATLTGLDAVVGGVRAGLEEKFRADVLLSGFLVNTLLAVLLAYMGEQVGVDLFLAAVVAIGGRVFLNLSLIRRYVLTRVALSKKEL